VASAITKGDRDTDRQRCEPCRDRSTRAGLTYPQLLTPRAILACAELDALTTEVDISESCDKWFINLCISNMSVVDKAFGSLACSSASLASVSAFAASRSLSKSPPSAGSWPLPALAGGWSPTVTVGSLALDVPVDVVGLSAGSWPLPPSVDEPEEDPVDESEAVEVSPSEDDDPESDG
jgi:hypothetical protein